MANEKRLALVFSSPRILFLEKEKKEEKQQKKRKRNDHDKDYNNLIFPECLQWRWCKNGQMGRVNQEYGFYFYCGLPSVIAQIILEYFNLAEEFFQMLLFHSYHNRYSNNEFLKF